MSGTGSPSHSNPTSRPATPGSLPQDSETKGKITMLIGILRKFLGVADLAGVRFSLPANLMEPIPNLEYWNYLDYPNAFANIGESDDDLERCLAVLTFWFTKDLKFIKGKPCKVRHNIPSDVNNVGDPTNSLQPYNSTLGEFFRCHWDVENTEGSDAKPTRISARFTGTSIRVAPGNHNLGIFIDIHNGRINETWNLTHPAAHLGGLLTGALSITVQDICYITCPKLKLKVILHYLDEPWVGRSKYRVEGVIFKYDPENDTITRIKDVPDKDIKARIDGCWISELYYTPAGSKEKKLIVDVKPLFPATKFVPSNEDQLDNESRKMWQKVTDAILSKNFNEATRLKVEIEDQKRREAAERDAQNSTFVPQYFVVGGEPGIPTLKEEGRAILDAMSKGDYKMTTLNSTS
ncbi:hypothetical protein AOL_s00169g8 [Orbilia oligospora ATCC 24927]|uniref:Oxysterol binding protein n=2 Tax=Orbilia oligospora TaxID=2813651 RepID=G1XMF5_ARTOA|nr:hypothetical protein AOL_s00169g8 [Orbilia oligospora ATCC 24927]EGX45674.1 hypothetical protein AOL_s00169g8 [Orbilia oligospora ATCC 24927]KAF3118826.1 hypothetical protein TWF703_004263 [Orbilia oligospora]